VGRLFAGLAGGSPKHCGLQGNPASAGFSFGRIEQDEKGAPSNGETLHLMAARRTSGPRHAQGRQKPLLRLRLEVLEDSLTLPSTG